MHEKYKSHVKMSSNKIHIRALVGAGKERVKIIDPEAIYECRSHQQNVSGMH